MDEEKRYEVVVAGNIADLVQAVNGLLAKGCWWPGLVGAAEAKRTRAAGQPVPRPAGPACPAAVQGAGCRKARDEVGVRKAKGT